jgi:hypothetical protein
MLTVLTQKPPFSTGNLRLLILAAPARLERELRFARQQDLPVPGAMRGPSRGQRATALTSRHQLPYALMYEDNPDP